MPGNAIFINYRRSDSSGYAGRLRDHLVTQFGHDRVFMDVGILGGKDWVVSIEQALSASGAMLTIIGANWDSPRLQDPDDRLRQELEAAMALEAEIIPVLVGGARMPDEADLPPSLQNLARRQAVRLTDEGWEDDVRRLTRRLAQLVAPAVAAPALVAPAPVPPKVKPKTSLVGVLFASLIYVAFVAVAVFVVSRFILEDRGGIDSPSLPNAKITVSPDSGPPGATVTVTGTGFPADTDIKIWLQGPQAEARSDGSGGFTATFKVPTTPFPGIDEVRASGGAFSDSALFTIEGS